MPNAVRIIGGQWKRSKLPVIDSPGLRPTPDRVRETLFNWLGQDLTGWRCLDAFAGSGALGFEAASRHAAQVVLLERSRPVAESLRQHQQRLKAANVRIEAADAMVWMAACAPRAFEVIFLDPPWDSGLTLPALELCERALAVDGSVYVESGQSWDESRLSAEGWRLHRAARAGVVHFALLQRG
jgi:16S rRNA (guanine(966)-N(2))-methyltransferase RsmD